MHATIVCCVRRSGKVSCSRIVSWYRPGSIVLNVGILLIKLFFNIKQQRSSSLKFYLRCTNALQKFGEMWPSNSWIVIIIPMAWYMLFTYRSKMTFLVVSCITIYYRYEVIFVGVLVGIVDFMNRLLETVILCRLEGVNGIIMLSQRAINMKRLTRRRAINQHVWYLIRLNHTFIFQYLQMVLQFYYLCIDMVLGGSCNHIFTMQFFRVSTTVPWHTHLDLNDFYSH
jgi:hypothetical protein